MQIENRPGEALPKVGETLRVGWPATVGQIFGEEALAEQGQRRASVTPATEKRRRETDHEKIRTSASFPTCRARRGGLGGTGRSARTRSAAAEESKKIIVGTWGGDYALLHKNIEMPILKDGWEVVQDTGDPTRRARQNARRAAPAARHVRCAGPSALNMSPR